MVTSTNSPHTEAPVTGELAGIPSQHVPAPTPEQLTRWLLELGVRFDALTVRPELGTASIWLPPETPSELVRQAAAALQKLPEVAYARSGDFCVALTFGIPA